MRFIDRSRAALKDIFSNAVYGESTADRARKPQAIDALVARAQPLADPRRADYEARLRDVLAMTRTASLEKLQAADIVVALDVSLRDKEGPHEGRAIDAVFYAPAANDTGKPVLVLFDNGRTRKEAGIWGSATADYAATALEKFAALAAQPIRAEKLVAVRRTYAAGRASAYTMTEWCNARKTTAQPAPKP